MKNVDVKIEKQVLTLTIDLSQSQGPSKSGKTQIIASTEGNQVIGLFNNKPVIIGLNIYTK